MKTSKFPIHPAVLTVYAALIASAFLIPGIPMLVTGGTFTAAEALIPLSGIFFGPWLGALTASVGCFIGHLIEPAGAWMGIFTFLTGTLSALCCGLAFYRRGLWTAILEIAGIGIHALLPQGTKSMLFAVTMFGSGCVASLLVLLLQKIQTLSSKIKLPLLVFLCCFIGLTCSGALYQIANMLLFRIPVISWKILAVSAPMERLLFSAGGVVIGVPLMKALPKIGIYLGPDVFDKQP